jgi:hypothetical protein
VLQRFHSEHSTIFVLKILGTQRTFLGSRLPPHVHVLVINASCFAQMCC